MENERFLLRIFLNTEQLGANKINLFGSLPATQFQSANMAQAGHPEDLRRNFDLFIDESQTFSNDVFVSVFAEACKHRLSLVLSQHYITHDKKAKGTL